MIEPIDTAPKDGAKILCLCSDGETRYCWWLGCSESEGFWMTEQEAEPRAWYANKRLPPELRAARRPKPPSLAGEALKAQSRMWAGSSTHDDWELVRAALERLRELEEQGND